MSRPRFCFQWWRSFILAWSGSFPVWCCERVVGYSSLRGRKRRCNLPASVMVAEQAFMLELSSGCRAGPGRAGRPAERGRHTLWNINDLLKRRTQPPPRYPSLPPSSHLPPCCSFPLSLSVSSPLRLPLSPSSSPSLPLSLSQEGCEIVLCHIKETGALQSEKYDIIRIIRGNLWIRHRSLDPCESGFLEFSRSFISFLSVSLWTYWINLSVSSQFLSSALFFILSLSLSPLPPSLPPSLPPLVLIRHIKDLHQRNNKI